MGMASNFYMSKDLTPYLEDGDTTDFVSRASDTPFDLTSNSDASDELPADWQWATHYSRFLPNYSWESVEASPQSSGQALAPLSPPAATPSVQRPIRPTLPEDGLVDITENEGRKRGDELMAMLMPEDLPAAEIPSCLWPSSAPPGEWGLPVTSFGKQSSPSYEEEPEGWAAARNDGPANGVAESKAARNTEVRKAIHVAFGERVASIEEGAHGDFVVTLCSGNHAGSLRNPSTQLRMLSSALWDVMGNCVTSLEPTVTPGCSWLTVHCIRKPSGRCKTLWFGRSSRGGRLCVEQFVLQPESFDIEVTF